MNAFIKAVICILYTVIIITAGAQLTSTYPKTTVYEGSELNVGSLDAYHYLLISAEKVQIQGAANDFFVLLKPGAEVIVAATINDATTDWTTGYDYATRETEVPGGKWTVSPPPAVVHVKGDHSIRVEVVPTVEHIDSTHEMLGVLLFVAWVIGLALIIFIDI